ncbi:MAG: hypothetical protein ACP5UO_04585 [Thermoplasmata archaeon]
MKKSVKMAIIAIVGAVVVVMATVFAYSIIVNQQPSTSPLSYIPNNSSLVLYVNYNGTKAFIFHWENDTALLLNAANVKGSNISIPYGNHTFHMNMTLYKSYRGYQIFSLNVSAILPETKNYSKYLSYFNVNETNVTIFSYIPYGSSIVLGSLPAVEGSIDAYLSDNGFRNGSLLNQDNNISFYYSPKNSTSHITLAWGGANETAAYAFIEFRNGSSLNLSYLQMIPGVKVTTVSQNEIEISFPLTYLQTLVNQGKK